MIAGLPVTVWKRDLTYLQALILNYYTGSKSVKLGFRKKNNNTSITIDTSMSDHMSALDRKCRVE